MEFYISVGDLNNLKKEIEKNKPDEKKLKELYEYSIKYNEIYNYLKMFNNYEEIINKYNNDWESISSHVYLSEDIDSQSLKIK